MFLTRLYCEPLVFPITIIDFRCCSCCCGIVCPPTMRFAIKRETKLLVQVRRYIIQRWLTERLAADSPQCKIQINTIPSIDRPLPKTHHLFDAAFCLRLGLRIFQWLEGRCAFEEAARVGGRDRLLIIAGLGHCDENLWDFIDTWSAVGQGIPCPLSAAHCRCGIIWLDCRRHSDCTDQLYIW